MSGDVQPRKRKDKKRKRDEDESKEHHHGVHVTNMGNEDVHLHVHSDHETGGHWCAKIFFFSLMAILVGLIGLIIIENRGLSDLDTPLSKSRFSNYFDGWVDENRGPHDEHDPVAASIEEHEQFDEPFEEEEDDHSEIEQEDDENHEGDHEDNDDGDDNDHEDEIDTQESREETQEYTQAKQDEDRDNETTEEDLDEETAEEETIEEATETIEVIEADDDFQENEETNKETKEETNVSLEDDQEDEENVSQIRQPIKSQPHQHANERSIVSSEDDDEPFDEEDDDGNFESLENIIENDAEELLLLKKKDRQQVAGAENRALPPEDESQPSFSSSQIKPKQDGGSKPKDDYDEDFLDEELRKANEEMLREKFTAALKIYDSLSQKYLDKPRVFLGQAKCLDNLSEVHGSNQMLGEALKAYKRYLAFGDEIRNTTEFKSAAKRCIDRMRFMGYHMQAVAIHEALIERFSIDPSYRNQLAVTYLMTNRLSDAKAVLEETLHVWPDDGFALVHYGFVLKNLDKNWKAAVEYLQRGIDSEAEGTKDGRFFFSLGDALQRLGRQEEALRIYERGVALQLYPSVYQRSLYNVPGLLAKPFWVKEETPYSGFLDILENNWDKIRDEGLRVLNERGFFLNEMENLKDIGDWKQFELFARGQRKQNCLKTPLTCGIIETFAAARFCKRGQIKFSVMNPGTHVWPHCGPTNCRLRAHLGLKVPTGTYLRVADELRTWIEGKFIIFDDSFEHEVWHNGTTGLRLVLIVDIWHPDLTEKQRQGLSPI